MISSLPSAGCWGRMRQNRWKGRSLLPALKDGNSRIRQHLFLAHAKEMRAVRTDDDWKLIHYFVNGQVHQQLYNLNEDPWEINNLINEPAFQLKKDTLMQLLLRSMEEQGDDFFQVYISLEQQDFNRPVEARMASAIPTVENSLYPRW